VAVEPDQVAAFLGKPDDTAILDTAEQTIPIVTVMVKAYLRGTGDWEPNDELEAVIVTAAARMVSNPGSSRTTSPPVRSPTPFAERSRMVTCGAVRVEQVPQTRLVDPEDRRQQNTPAPCFGAGVFWRSRSSRGRACRRGSAVWPPFSF
jgi:hypothetical protein